MIEGEQFGKKGKVRNDRIIAIERENHIFASVKKIDDMGGTLAAIESGYIQREIQNAAYEYQKRVERGEAVVVGVNKFQAQAAEPLSIFRVDPAIEKRQIERVRELRASRSAALCAERLHALEQCASGTGNLMPHIFAACEAKATVGEISDQLRTVFGEYRE